MSEIIERIRKELIQKGDENVKRSGERFFREEVAMYGLRSAEVGEISQKHFRALTGNDKEAIFGFCEELWKSGMMEESFIACNWSYRIHKSYKPSDFMVFDRWVKNYVSNWASCDTLCNHSVGTFMEMYPDYLQELKKWAGSENRWVKRASSVSLIIPARRGKFLEEIFTIADILHSDSDDMVQKGYGWMLKAASQAHQEEVFRYVISKKSTMPRTALRYAIEKMPSELKAEAMRK